MSFPSFDTEAADPAPFGQDTARKIVPPLRKPTGATSRQAQTRGRASTSLRSLRQPI